MADRDEQFKQHEVWQTLDGFDQALDFEADASHLQDIESLRALANHVRRVLEQADPNLIPLANVVAINTQLTKASTQLSTFRSNSAPQNLTAALNSIDPVLLAIAPIWAARSPEDVGQIRDDVGRFRKSASQLVNGLSSEVDDAKKAVAELAAARAALQKEIEDQKGRLDAAISEHQSQFSVAQESRSSAHDAIIAEYQSQFSVAQESRSSAGDAARAARQAKFEEQAKSLEDRANELLQKTAQGAADAHESEREDHEARVVVASSNRPNSSR